jgi:hypothetical protein
LVTSRITTHFFLTCVTQNNNIHFQIKTMNQSIFEIFMQDNSLEYFMKIKEIKNRTFVELAYHLHLFSTNPCDQLFEEYMTQLQRLTLEEVYDLFETIAYCNFNSSLAVDQLIWRIGETEKLHHSFFEIDQLRRGVYEVKSVCPNQFVRAELKKKLNDSPYNPHIYHCRFVKIDVQYLNECIKVGNLRLIKWTIETHNIKPTSGGSANWACQYGDLKVIKYLYETCGVKPTSYGADLACPTHMQVVDYIHQAFNITPTSMGANWACSKSNLEVVKYLYVKFKIKPTSEGANFACLYGHLQVLKCINDTLNVRPDIHGFELACENGHLEVIKYLYQTCKINPTSAGIDQACSNGHLEVVKYLHRICGVNPTSQGLIGARWYNHGEIEGYINSNVNIT